MNLDVSHVLHSVKKSVQIITIRGEVMAKQKKCITIECGLQNGTLAIFVATSIFGGGMYVVPAATYSLIMFATSLIFVYLVRKIV